MLKITTSVVSLILVYIGQFLLVNISLYFET